MAGLFQELSETNLAKFYLWLKRFWVARGVFAAISVVGVITQIVDLSRFEALEGILAVLDGWHKLTGLLGELLGEFPWIPEFSGASISSFLILTTIFLPVFAHNIVHTIDQFRWSKIAALFSVALILFSLPVVVMSIFLIYIVLGGDYTLHPMYQLGDNANQYNVGLFERNAILTLSSIFFVGSFAVSRLYRSSILFVAGFLLAIQIMYFLASPLFPDRFKEFTCYLRDVPATECKVD